MQGEVLQATRQRIVDDMARAVTILKDAAGDARKAIAPREPAGKAAAKPVARTAAKRPAPARRTVKAKAKAKAKTKTKTKAKAKTKAASRTRARAKRA
jgi:hypothetical protein